MKKLSIILLLLALVLAVVPAALAQDDVPFGTSEDFAAWIAANEATFASTSLSFDGSISFEMTGMGEGTEDTSADLKISGAVINDEENPGVQLDVTGKVVSGAESTPVDVGLRLIDGTIYYNDGTGWKFTSEEEASSMLGSELSTSGLPIDPSMLSGSSDMGDMSSMMSGLGDIKPSDFLSLTHEGDDYTLALDVGALLSSPAISGLIGGAVGGAMGSGQEMTDAQLQQMSQMFAMMFSEAVVSLTETVDSASMVNHVVLNINFPLDNVLGPGALLALNVDINLSGFNEPVTVEVPEGAVAAEASS